MSRALEAFAGTVSLGLTGAPSLGGPLLNLAHLAVGTVAGAARAGTSAIGALGAPDSGSFPPPGQASALGAGPSDAGGALADAAGLAAPGLPAPAGPYAPGSTRPAGSGPAGSHYGAVATGDDGRLPDARAGVAAPAQGVAVPGSAAAASGFGLSLFIMLAGLLVLGALPVSGRLRLSSELWRPAPFVWKLARPG